MRTLRSALLALAVALVAGALGTGTALADTVVIDSVDTPAPAFSPPNVTIHTGDTVRFEFDSATTTHTVTSTSANWTINETKAPNERADLAHVRHRRARTRSCAACTTA